MKSAGWSLLIAVCVATSLAAQEAPAPPAAEKEHEWLMQFVGDWVTTSEAMVGPDQPLMKCEGTMNTRALGGFWVVSEVKNEMPGMQVTGLQTIGYDAKAKQYVGTWVDSTNGHIWHYTGSVDATGKNLTLEADGPNFVQPDKLSKFRDAYEFKDKDHIVQTSSMQDDSGKWITFMTGTMRRKH